MTYTRNKDGTYGPVLGLPIKDGKPLYIHFYKPQNYHNKTARKKKDKEKWILKEGEQFHYFKIADENNISPRWLCKQNSCLFSVGDNGRVVLGVAGERLAKFKIPQNESDSWHGYPVSPDERWNTPSEELLDLWVEHEIIDDTTRTRIERSRL